VDAGTYCVNGAAMLLAFCLLPFTYYDPQAGSFISLPLEDAMDAAPELRAVLYYALRSTPRTRRDETAAAAAGACLPRASFTILQAVRGLWHLRPQVALVLPTLYWTRQTRSERWAF